MISRRKALRTGAGLAAIAAASMVSILLALSVVLVLERLIGLKAYVKL